MNDIFDCKVVIRFLARKCVRGKQQPQSAADGTVLSVAQQALAYMPGSRIRLRTPRRERRDESKWKNLFDSIVRLGLGIYWRLERANLLVTADNGEIHLAQDAISEIPSSKLRWFQKVLAFRNSILKMASDDSFSFRSLETIPIRKSNTEDRIIAKFTDLREAAILACLAKYLTEHFDPYLSGSACAFRSGGKGGFNEAARQIRNMRRISNNNQPLYVAECDLKKFYDTVNHDLLQDAFDVFAECCRKDVSPLDDRAKLLLAAYLRCYSFKHSVLESKSEKMRRSIDRKRIPWVDESELRNTYAGMEVPYGKIGIPQGGAISPLLANIMLHSVDRLVRCEHGRDVCGDDFLYTRFCDDMIIVSADKRMCESAFARYCNEAKRLKLLMHSPKAEIAKYSARWWQGKTRATYEWSKDAIPWVGFVGYQIRYDGEIRLRKQSLDRVGERLRCEIGATLKEMCDISKDTSIDDGVRWKELLDMKMRAIMHITKRLTGKSYLRFRNGRRVRQYCWADAFSLLSDSFKESVIARRQIGNIDRLRNDWLNWFNRKVNALLPEKLRQPHGFWRRSYSIFDAFEAAHNHLRKANRARGCELNEY